MLSTRKLYALWRKYNAQVFSGVLHPAKITHGRTDVDVLEGFGVASLYGYCEDVSRTRVRIHIDEGCTPAQAEATLLHEMVHQYQHQSGLEMEHDRAFEAWRSPILACTGHDILEIV